MNMTIYTKSNTEIPFFDIDKKAIEQFEDWFSNDNENKPVCLSDSNNASITIKKEEISFYKTWYFDNH
jgi:hypothetical protein